MVSIGLAGAVAFAGVFGVGQQDRRGRKYKAPPATSHIEVVVTKRATGKPIPNAAVILRASKDGKDAGNLEVKTDPDGKASLDVITTGSKVLVQVIANGYATYADEFQVDEASREIHVALLRPREQVSAYEDNYGKAATRKPGIQEPEPAPKGPETPTLQPRTTPAPAAGTGAATAAPSAAGEPETKPDGIKSPDASPDQKPAAKQDAKPDAKPTPDTTQSAPQL